MGQPNKRRCRVDTGVYDAAFSFGGKILRDSNI